MDKSTRPEPKSAEKTTLGDLVDGLQQGTYTRAQVIEAMQPLEVIHHGAVVSMPEPEIEGTNTQPRASTMQPQPSEYDLAMGRNPAGRQAEDERFAFGDHRDELTGDLAKVRDAHARAEIDRAAAEFRQRDADFEMGA